MLALERKEDLQIAIEEQQEMGLEELGEEDKYLMVINLDVWKQLLESIRLLLATFSSSSSISKRCLFVTSPADIGRMSTQSTQPLIEMSVCLHSRTNVLYILPVYRLIDESVNISQARA